MQVPLEITFRHVRKTPELEQFIRDRAAALEKVCDHITSCRIAVEKQIRHSHTGKACYVRLDIMVPPNHEIVVTRHPDKGETHLNVETDLREAFDAATLRLEELVELQRGDVKKHPAQEVRGVVIKLFPMDGYGFVRSLDGREIYFHRNSVTNDGFDRLKTGTGVWFVEEQGEKGPQATTVRIIEPRGFRVS